MSATDTADGGSGKKKMMLGIAGMILGLIGMFSSIGGPHIVDNFYPPQSVDAEAAAEAAAGFIADVASKTGKKLAKGAADKARGLFSRDKGNAPVGSEFAASPQQVKGEPEVEKAPPKETLKQSRARLASTFTVTGIICGILAIFSGLMGWAGEAITDPPPLRV